MPLSKYFKGAGEKVMSGMQSEYGGEKGKRVFYATANAKGMAPKEPKSVGGKRDLLAGARRVLSGRGKV